MKLVLIEMYGENKPIRRILWTAYFMLLSP